MTSLMEHGRLLSHHLYSLHRSYGPLQASRSHTHIPLEGRLTSITSNIERAKQLKSNNISSDLLIRSHREAITHLIGVLAAGLVLAAGCAPAEAYNVRLQDVENKAMQAGEQPGACYTAPSCVAQMPGISHAAMKLPEQALSIAAYVIRQALTQVSLSCRCPGGH